jgi:phytoene dehydrogenase-like protein
MKKVIVIGGGIAGISTGCYMQMNDYDCHIFEMSPNPGGLCTAWKRKGYTFDGCIHWLVGSSPTEKLYKFWQELGVIKSNNFINFDDAGSYEDGSGKVFTLYTNADKLRGEMISFAPEDMETIDEFIKAVKEITKYKMPIDKAPQLYNIFEIIKLGSTMLPYMKFLKKWNLSLSEYSKKYKNEFLRKIFNLFFSEIYDFPTSNLLFMISWMGNKCGYPIGGSLAITNAMEKRYLGLKGKISYNSKVAKVLVNNGKACGVELENKERFDADIVISAADGHNTIFDMLEGKFVDKGVKEVYDKFTIYPSIMQVSIGIADWFEGTGGSISFPAKETIKIDSINELKTIKLNIFNYDKTLAPEGKTSVVSYFKADYFYWTSLKNQNEKRYSAEKERIAMHIIESIENRFPGISPKVEVFDVATPATYVRYTNNWKGSYEGWIPDIKSFSTRINNTLSGLENFYMVGQWVMPGGGLPSGAITARFAVQYICKKDRKKFQTFSE